MRWSEALGLLALAALIGCGESPGAADPPTATPFPPGDPSGAVPYLVRDINPGASPARPTQLVTFRGQLAFAADDGVHGAELWMSDGTAAGTRLVKDICPGACSSSPRDLLPAHGRLYFAAAGGGGEPTVWVSDGTEAGTVDFLAPGTRITSPSDFVAVGSEVVFTASDPVQGRELWRTDATRAGTRRVADILPGVGSGVPVFKPAVHDGILYFAGDDGRGRRLFRSDGTLEGTFTLGAPVNDLFPSFRTVGSALLFAGGSGPGSTRDQLWRTDGTLSGTRVVAAVDPDGIMAFEGAAFFHGWTSAVDQAELWRSDGTPGGTVMVADIRPGRDAAFVSTYRAGGLVHGLRDRVFFLATDGSSGEELWAYRLPLRVSAGASP